MPPELREALESAIQQSETAEEAATSSATATDAEVSAASGVEQGSQEESPDSKSESAPVVEDDGAEGKGEEADSASAQPEVKEGEKAGEQKPAQQTAEERAAHRVDRAPTSWKKEAKAAWAELPLHVRQEIHRREQHINQALVENSRNREAVESLNKVTGPYMARLQTMGGTMPAIERLLQAEYVLATGTAEQTAAMMAQLIRDYEVDLVKLDGLLAGQSPSPTPGNSQPDIAQLVQQQVQQALAPFQQQQQQRQQQVQQEAVTTVEEMSLDPRYPHFEDVREDMADIIEMRMKRGIATTLEEAYTIAVNANPATASAIRQQGAMQTATQQHQQAQRAKAAASSVSGSPATGGSAAQVGDGSLRGAIEAAFGGQRL